MKITLLLAVLLGLSPLAVAQSHFHVNTGVLDANGNHQPDAGESLHFVNGDEYDVASGFAVPLTYRDASWIGTPSARYLGTFSGNITFTALSADIDNGEYGEEHAALGTHIVMQMVAVSGPAGGTFSFWDSTGSAPAVSVATGATPPSTARWDLSQNPATPGADPFGHIHGRQFSVDQAGTYVVTFQLFDTSMNGVGGNPLHSPSETFQMKFVATPVPEPAITVLVAIGAIAAMVGNCLRRQP